MSRLASLFAAGRPTPRRSTREAGRASRAATRLAVETLDARLCMAADLGQFDQADPDARVIRTLGFGLAAPQPAFQMMSWNGRSASARVDSWVVRSSQGLASTITVGPGAGTWRTENLGEGFWSISTPGASAAQVSQWARTQAGVSLLEPDFALESRRLPDDPRSSQLYGLDTIRAPRAWDTTVGSRNVVVAVIDTGIDYRHPDLAANVWRNPGEVAGDGIDNDGNGFTDDVHGYDFFDEDGDPMDLSLENGGGHGTHVAGTIGAVGNNGTGVTGVSWQVSLMGVRFLGPNGGSISAAIRAVNYVTRMRRDFGVNVVATNNSWGGGGFSTALRDAIEAGGRAGILFVAAAGNETNNNDASPSYPASYTSEAIISVAATDRNDRLASFSNFGTTSVDVAAPGVGILSTTPNGSYASFSGTSMATPHVAGTVALLAAARPEATAAQIRAAILGSARPVAGLAGSVATGGVLDAAAALAALGTAPAPTPTPTPNPEPNPEPTPVPQPGPDLGDTLATALRVNAQGSGVRLTGLVGDGPAATADVDLAAVTLRRGERLRIDVDARSLASGSTLDSYVRVFDGRGRQVALNDDAHGSLDSFLEYRASQAGTYYVGISGFGNGRYNARSAGSGAAGSTGLYEVSLAITPAGRAGRQAAGTAAEALRSLPPAAFAAFGAANAGDFGQLTGTTARPRVAFAR